MNKKLNNKLSVVVLCGGKGERLRPLTKNLPKPLIKIKKKNILSYIIEQINSFRLNEIFIASGYKHKLIKNFFNKKHKNCKINVINSGINSDIIKRIKSVIKYSNENLLVCYGDTLANINIDSLYNFHVNHGYPVTISSYEMKTNFGVLDIGKKGKVKKYKEKPSLNIWFNIGYIIINKKIFSSMAKFKKFEHFLNYIVQKSLVKSFKHKGIHITINTIQELEEAKKLVVKFDNNIKK